MRCCHLGMVVPDSGEVIKIYKFCHILFLLAERKRGSQPGLFTRPPLVMGGWVSVVHAVVTRREFWMGVGGWVGTHLLTRSSGYQVW